MKAAEHFSVNRDHWSGGTPLPLISTDALQAALLQVNKPIFIFDHLGEPAFSSEGSAAIGNVLQQPDNSFPLQAYIPPLHPASLGDPRFREKYGLQYAYIAGAMANGITSVDMVRAIGEQGMLGFFFI